MSGTSPIAGPELFRGAGQDMTPEQIQVNALAFIAQRMAGIEWELHQLNETVLKAQSSLYAVAQTLPKMVL